MSAAVYRNTAALVSLIRDFAAYGFYTVSDRGYQCCITAFDLNTVISLKSIIKTGNKQCEIFDLKIAADYLA